MILTIALAIGAIILGWLVLGLPGALIAVVAIGLTAAYDTHQSRVQRHQDEIAALDHAGPRSVRQTFGD